MVDSDKQRKKTGNTPPSDNKGGDGDVPDDEKLAFAVSLFNKLSDYKRNGKATNQTIDIFSDSRIKNLTWVQIQLKLKNKDLENYHLFFLVEFILFITFIIQLYVIKIFTDKERLFFLSNSFYINENKKIILPSIFNSIPNIKLLNINEYKQMIESFIKLNKDQQEEILLLSEFILNHEGNDQLWSEYDKLIKDVKTFLS